MELRTFSYITESEVGKMGKRYHNAVNPDDVVAEYGADCFRMYEMFLGPIEQSKPWDINNIDGVGRFVRRFWSLFIDDNGNWVVQDETPSDDARKILNQAIYKVREDIERYSFNTCVSHFMTAVNELKKVKCHHREILDAFVRLVAPFAPFITEELWERLGNEGSVHHAQYPVADEKYLVDDTILYPVCINGKKRTELEVDAGASNDSIEQAALALESIQKWIDGKEIRRVIIVPNRMVNIVV